MCATPPDDLREKSLFGTGVHLLLHHLTDALQLVKAEAFNRLAV